MKSVAPPAVGIWYKAECGGLSESVVEKTLGSEQSKLSESLPAPCTETYNIIYIDICVCVCVCVCLSLYIYIKYIFVYMVSSSFFCRSKEIHCLQFLLFV